jgi:thiaminase/transcriptional activator TenA
VSGATDSPADRCFSERLRAAALPTWNRALDHRFFRAVVSDEIGDADFEQYLRIEYGFVDCAAVVLGFAVAKAPSFVERRRLAHGLFGLVTDQEQFFVAAFERMATAADRRTGLGPQGRAAPLHALFMATAQSAGYEEILSCMLAAEWLYATWCGAAARTPSRRAYIRDWVALHAGGSFVEHVTWMRDEIDARGPALPPARQTAMQQLFEQALAAEISFHDAPYDR